MGLETLLYVALAGTAGAAAAGAFSSKPSKPKFPPVSTPKVPAVKATKSMTEASMAFLAARKRRGGSREASRIAMPGFLDPAQIQRPTLSSVLGDSYGI